MIALISWIVLALLLVALGLVAHHFSRRTYRICVSVVVVASVIGLAEYGATFASAKNLVDAFGAGSRHLIEAMFNPLFPGTRPVVPGIASWVVLLAVLAFVLIMLDTHSARREQPRVEILSPPAAEVDHYGLEDRRALTEELGFRLPAVYVRRPATAPGGLTLDNLATIVEKSEVRGGKLAGALMRVVHALEGQPRTYQARCFVETCAPAGRLSGRSTQRRITVDIQDARTGRSIAVQMLPACDWEDASEKVAGYAARQVFLGDPSTPAWAVGSRDGQDLAAYLEAQEICAPPKPSYNQLRQSRTERRKVLEYAIEGNSAPGVVGHELAAMYDLDGDYLKALQIHLRNRVHYPQFWAGRYRLAMSLSALAWLISGQLWGNPNTPSEVARQLEDSGKDEITRHLGSDELLDGLDDGSKRALQGNWWNDKDPTGVCKALLGLAEKEFAAVKQSQRVANVLRDAFLHRELRAARLAALRNRPKWHASRHYLASEIAIKTIEQRRNLLESKGARSPSLASARRVPEEQLRSAIEEALDLLGVGERTSELPCGVPWQAAYNAACLFALSDHRLTPEVRGVSALTLLQLAIEDPKCNLQNPSEEIAMDPDLMVLRNRDDFTSFVRHLAKVDFEASSLTWARDHWFGSVLPVPKP